MPYGKELRHDFALLLEIFFVVYIRKLCAMNSENLGEHICINVAMYIITVAL